MQDIVLIAHDIRSCHNVGSLLRTAEGLGVKQVFLTGYTPYPMESNDTRLPHIAQKLHKQISKTALGAEETLKWSYSENILAVLDRLSDDGYELVALEQNPRSTTLPVYVPANKVALLLGREVEGLDTALLDRCKHILEIPMFGKKESFNVVQAAAMALYHMKFYKS